MPLLSHTTEVGPVKVACVGTIRVNVAHPSILDAYTGSVSIPEIDTTSLEGTRATRSLTLGSMETTVADCAH